jgi:hypothetical protein
MSAEQPEENDPSMGHLQRFVTALAADAARILSEHPLAQIVGLIAESGTIECRRARTLVEQGTGREHTTESFAGLLPPAALSKILDASFPADAITWMMDADRIGQLQIVICTKDAVRIATVKLPASG